MTPASSPAPSSSLVTPEVVLASVIGGILCVLLFPLPPVILDLLLVLNISLAVMLMLMMFYLENPLDLSGFPSLLLVMTLFRLSLNVASTKLILLDGQAGAVIQAFGQSVVGNNYLVGTVVFLILVMIQFIVITKGAGRIAEVAARFTLDAMPGKQMSIDADLNAGIIDEDEARSRRQRISDEAEFYGAMDGASKFVKGDAVAGLAITAVNILGGLAVGVMQQGMRLTDALQTYTILTIGDGLVSQIPALIISVASGILVTKTASNDFLGRHLQKQLLRRPEPLYLGGIMLIGLGVVPGLPLLPFAVMGGLCLLVGRRLSETAKAGPGGGANQPGGHGRPAAAGGVPALPGGGSPDEPPAKVAMLPPMQLEIGFSLVPLVDEQRGGDLVSRISMIREQVQEEFGFLVPSVSVQDNLELANNEYRVLLHGLERARGQIYPGSHLAIDSGGSTEPLEGVQVTEPAFGYDAYWIRPSRADAAEARGYTVVNPETVIATHLTKIIREHAGELLSRQEVSEMLEQLKEQAPSIVEDVSPETLPLAVVHRVLQHLLREQVPIHDISTVLETLTDHINQSKDPVVLGEFCRQALASRLIACCVDPAGTLHALTLNPELEEEIQRTITPGQGVGSMDMAPARASAICETIQQALMEQAMNLEADPVLIVSPLVRYHLHQLLARRTPDLRVLSYGEILDDVPLAVHNVIQMSQAKEAIPA